MKPPCSADCFVPSRSTGTNSRMDLTWRVSPKFGIVTPKSDQTVKHLAILRQINLKYRLLKELMDVNKILEHNGCAVVKGKMVDEPKTKLAQNPQHYVPWSEFVKRATDRVVAEEMTKVQEQPLEVDRVEFDGDLIPNLLPTCNEMRAVRSGVRLRTASPSVPIPPCALETSSPTGTARKASSAKCGPLWICLSLLLALWLVWFLTFSSTVLWLSLHE